MRSHVIPNPKLPNVPNDLFGFEGSDFPTSMGKDFSYSQLAQLVRYLVLPMLLVKRMALV